MPKPKRMVSIFGGSVCTDKEANIAYKVGYELARRGWITLNGAGDCGVMLAASKGAHDGNGLVVGIVPENDISRMNEYIDIPITTNIGYNRNFINSNACPACISIGGHIGTLHEIAGAVMFKRPVVMINSFKVKNFDYRDDRPVDLLYEIEIEDTLDDVKKAVDLFEDVYNNRKKLGQRSYSSE